MTREGSRRGSSRRGVSRRRLLALAGAAGIGALAGCGYRPGGGDVRWETDAGGGLYRADDLLATGGTVFTVARSVHGFDWDTEEWGDSGYVTAYDAASGLKLWQHQGPPVGESATYRETLYVGTEEGTLLALGADGATRWRTSVGDFPRTVSAAGGRVYALTDSDDLVAFAADDGKRAWSKALRAGDEATLAATPNGVVVHHLRDDTGNATVTAIRRNGERRWERELSTASGIAGWRPAVVDGTLYATTDSDLFALSLRDGTKRWSKRVRYLEAAPAGADGTLYYVDRGTLYALDAADGSTRWRFEPRRLGDVTSPPAVGRGTVYVGADEAVYSVASEDGSVDWRAESSRVDTRPVVAERTVIVVVRNGVVHGHWRE